MKGEYVYGMNLVIVKKESCNIFCLSVHHKTLR